jgi:hypothetical protein
MAVSKMCAVSEVFCSVFDGHYTKSSNFLVSDEEKGRCALAMRVSHRKQRETRARYVCLR